MKQLLYTLTVFVFGITQLSADDNAVRLRELDAFWAEVSRSVQDRDFDGYKATCHREGVLVSATKKISQPLSKALARWKQGFDDPRAGKIKAKVDFRFSQRIGDDSTAHEAGYLPLFHDGLQWQEHG